MPAIKSFASERRACLVLTIFSLGEIMFFYSHYSRVGLVYIMIMSPSGRQFSSYAECIKVNMRSLCDVRSVSNSKYVHLICL